jgi:hypothetical protein
MKRLFEHLKASVLLAVLNYAIIKYISKESGIPFDLFLFMSILFCITLMIGW